LEELDKLIKEYPYFQSARILFSINLLNESNIRYDSGLKATAIYAGNRSVLKRHIDRASEWKEKASVRDMETVPVHQPQKQEQIEQPAAEETNENSIAQLKKMIEERIREIEKEKREKGEEQKKKPLSKKAKFSIIDDFIHNEPSISRSKGEFYDPVVKAKQSIVEQEDIVSETLAKVYHDQGYFEKAIENVSQSIRNFDALHGDGSKFHTTLTVASIKTVNHFMQKSKSHQFADFIQEFPRLKTSFKELLNQLWKK